jgi:uncharacterized protein (TIGR03067 family)
VQAGKVSARGTFDIDPNKKPRSLDLMFTEGGLAGKTVPAIYELKDGELWECFTIAGDARPTGFAADKDSKHLLFIYRRAKPDGGKEDPRSAELKRLDGTWELITTVFDGKRDDVPEGKRSLIDFRGNTYTLKLADNLGGGTGTIQIDPSKQPKFLDQFVQEGPDKGEIYPGIYELEEDKLQICFVSQAGGRPTEFTAERDSNRMLYIYRRLQPVGAQEHDIRKELKQLEGTWEMVSVVGDGKQQDFGRPIRITIQGNSFTAERIGTPSGTSLIGKGPLKVDPTQKLKTIDFIMTEGPGKGTRALMLYELQGDELRLCETKADETRKDLPRPTEFSAGPGSGRAISTLRRVKTNE